jgi:hypothetical protein
LELRYSTLEAEALYNGGFYLLRQASEIVELGTLYVLDDFAKNAKFRAIARWNSELKFKIQTHLPGIIERGD